MGDPNLSYQAAWNARYRSKGRLWAGAPHHLPPLGKDQRILELGCGDGKTLRAVAPFVCQAIGVDFSVEALSTLQSISSGNAGFFVLSDVCQLPFRDRVFDGAFAYHVLSHLSPDRMRLLAAEAERVLTNQGKLFVRVFSVDDMRAPQGNPRSFLVKKESEGILTWYFSKPELLQIFGNMQALNVSIHTWQVRIRGQYQSRSEITAVFQKNSYNF